MESSPAVDQRNLIPHRKRDSAKGRLPKQALVLIVFPGLISKQQLESEINTFHLIV